MTTDSTAQSNHLYIVYASHFMVKNKCFLNAQFCICSHKMKMGVKLKADYSAVLHMPVLKEGTERVSQLAGSMLGHQSYTQPGECKTNFITKETRPCRYVISLLPVLRNVLLFIWDNLKKSVPVAEAQKLICGLCFRG